LGRPIVIKSLCEVKVEVVHNLRAFLQVLEIFVEE